MSPFEEHLQSYTPIKGRLKELGKVNEMLQKSVEDIDNAIQQSERDRLVMSTERLIAKARADSQAIKAALVGSKGERGLKESNEEFARLNDPGSIQVEIRNCMYIYHMRKYYNLQKRFSSLSNQFRQMVHERAKRDIKIIAKQPLTDNQIEDIIEKGLDGKLVEAILQGQDQEELDRLMERSNVVNQINREVRNLLQMFQDMAALVDAQQETVDSITVHIASAKEYTGQAAVELIAAADYQLRARKKMCICIVLVLIIVGVIVGIVVATQEGNNNNNN
ncbi:hypothetical protein AAMO2058_001153000 [Amorphochlora amoebiformis]